MRSNFEQIVLYYIGLSTQNPGLREVDLESSHKRHSDKIYKDSIGICIRNNIYNVWYAVETLVNTIFFFS